MVTAPGARPAARAASSSRSSSTTGARRSGCPSRPCRSWSAPRDSARSDICSGAAPSSRPSDSVSSTSSSVPSPRSRTSARGPSRSTRSSSRSRNGWRAVTPRPGRHAPGDLVDERLLARAEVVGGQRQHEQPDATVDVVSHAAGRDDACPSFRRRDPADREAVALVDVRHREGGVDDARQAGHVLELLERAVVADRGQELLVREHARGHAHVSPGRLRDLPEDLVDAAGGGTAPQARRRGTPLRSRAAPSSIRSISRCGRSEWKRRLTRPRRAAQRGTSRNAYIVLAYTVKRQFGQFR